MNDEFLLFVWCKYGLFLYVLKKQTSFEITIPKEVFKSISLRQNYFTSKVFFSFPIPVIFNFFQDFGMVVFS